MEPLPEQESESITSERPPTPGGIVLTMLLFLVLAGSLLGAMAAQALCKAWGVELPDLLSSLSLQSSVTNRNLARWANGLAHFATFSLPALAVAFVLAKRRWARFLQLDRAPSSSLIAMSILLIFVSFPLVQVFYWFNKEVLPLPDFLRDMDGATQSMVEALLVMDSPWELLSTLVVVAILPAIGEELIFRGIVQPQLQRWLKNHHSAIWLTALLFGIIHFQFEGLLPRMFLGAILGYLLYWSKSLWAPIAAHFFFNGIQVLAQYQFKEQINGADLESMKPNIYLSLISLVAVLWLGWHMERKNQDKKI